MSTSYYRLKYPLTSIRLEQGPVHDKLTVFESGANAGTLTVGRGLGKALANMFADVVDDDKAPLRTHFGGADRGCVVTVQDGELPDRYTVVNDYGDVYTVGEVKAMDGNGKQVKP